jgi:transcriptional regulator with XRE-family HTH domain
MPSATFATVCTFPLRKLLAVSEIHPPARDAVYEWIADMPDMDFYERLREERLRLELTRESVAEIAGVSSRTVRRWETEIPMPLDALIALTHKGYDAQYVCTGHRSANRKSGTTTRGVREMPEAYSADEIDWIVRLRRMKPAERAQARAMLNVLVPRKNRRKSGV